MSAPWRLVAWVLLAYCALASCSHATAAKVHVGSAIIATTDARFLSFNIDMAEFTGAVAHHGVNSLDLSNPLLSRRLNDLGT